MNLELLKEARQSAGMSQEEVARRCGMSLNNYARIERGDTGTTVSTLEHIASVLGLELTLKTAKK